MSEATIVQPPWERQGLVPERQVVLHPSRGHPGARDGTSCGRAGPWPLYSVVLLACGPTVSNWPHSLLGIIKDVDLPPAMYSKVLGHKLCPKWLE